MNNSKILFASSEVAPFAKTGGLADVSGSLPQALHKLDVDIRVVMPKYKTIPQKFSEQIEYIGYIYVDIGWRHQYCGILKLTYEGIPIYFIDNEYYFNRDPLYGHADEAEQFVFFCKALIEMLPLIEFNPDVIHCNDWQTGIISLLLKAHYRKFPLYKDIKTVFTIHNLKYQGIFPKDVLSDLIGIGWEFFSIDGVEFYDQINFMKAALIYSDLITTVSPTYASEIQNDFFGENLQDIIRKRSNVLHGIINGIDYDHNNPATDKRIFVNYDIEHIDKKYENKTKLQQALGLPMRQDIPVIGIISRLVAQKGLDLIACVIHEILQQDLQLVILGTGEPYYENMFRHIAAQYPHKAAVRITYDDVLAQQIYAGSDLFLMPSLFEPCGLGQLFSLRYGTLPIVRETGGLKDTVTPYNEQTGEGNGFSFSNYNAHDMLYTIKYALSFYHDRTVWHNLVRRAMAQDFSWAKSARKYLDIYRHV